MEIGRPNLGQGRPALGISSLRSSDFRVGAFKIRTRPMNDMIATVNDANIKFRDLGFGQSIPHLAIGRTVFAKVADDRALGLGLILRLSSPVGQPG
jgi:hypothetical protein